MERYIRRFEAESTLDLKKIKVGSIIKHMDIDDTNVTYEAKVIDIKHSGSETFYVVKKDGRKYNVQVPYLADVVKY